MPKALVIDDDRAIRLQVNRALTEAGFEVSEAEDSQNGLAMFRGEQPDVVLLDVVLPKTSGLQTFQELRRIDRKTPIIFITAGSDSSTAIEAMQLGAYEYVTKPLDLPLLQDLCQQAVESKKLMDVPVAIDITHPENAYGEMFVGRSPAMLDVFKKIGRIASQNVAVLIRGESGTGKELVARAIYHHSDRSEEPFLAVNCAAIPDQLLESELFGHEKGAFTSADKRRIGKFEQCNGGTIFLDEVGDMSQLVQGKVLRLLQEQRFERVGGNETIQTDVRIITATNRDLEQMVEDSEFRADLLFRLNGMTISLPPLKERGDDLDALLEYFLSRQRIEHNKMQVEGVSPQTLDLLRAYRWPGNIRELQSVLRQSLINATGTVITPDCLPPGIRPTEERQTTSRESNEDSDAFDLEQFVRDQLQSDPTELYAQTLEAMERVLITRVLQFTQGNQSKASEILGITRGKIRDRIATFGIRVDKNISVEE